MRFVSVRKVLKYCCYTDEFYEKSGWLATKICVN